ncbi:MAG: VCBS repeat-containing protein [Kofleriaceae bacterium]
MLLLALVAGCSEHLDTTFIDAAPRDVRTPVDAGASNACATPRFPGWQRIPYPGGSFGTDNYAAMTDFGTGTPSLVFLGGALTIDVIPAFGDGTVATPITVATGRQSIETIVGDVDGDGRADIVYIGGDGISLLRGNGDLTFAPPDSLLALTDPGHTYLRAMRGGFVVNTQDAVYVFRAQADHTFAMTSWALSGGSWGIVAGDFDQDGIDDLAIVRPSGGASTVELYHVDGTLIWSQASDVFFDSSQLLVGDIDGDGNLDLVVDDFYFAFVIRGDGAGHLGAEQVIQWLTQIRIADIDHDGVDDIIGFDVSNGNGSPQTITTISRWDGPTGLLRPLALVPALQGFAYGDADHDGMPDLVGAADSGVVVVHGNGDGTFTSSTAQPLSDLTQAAFGDLDGDGLPEAIYVTANLSKVGIAHARADGTFDDPIEYDAFGRKPAFVVAGDLDHDGIADLVVEDTTNGKLGNNQASIVWWRGIGNAVFHLEPEVILAKGGSLRLADLDGDHRLEVLMSTGDILAVTGNQLALVATPFTSAFDMDAADVTGDGLPDLVATDGSGQFGQVLISENLGNGIFAGPISISLPDVPQLLALADLDGDGLTDIVASASELYVLHNNHNFRFTIDTYAVPTFRMYARDVDGNGSTDLVLIDEAATLDVMLNDGTGKLLPELVYPSFGAKTVDVRDVDGDGHPDILTIDSFPSQITVTPQRCAP